MDRYYSSAISKESSDVYSIPNSTQHDARQRCPALIVLKEENNNNNSTSYPGKIPKQFPKRNAPQNRRVGIAIPEFFSGLKNAYPGIPGLNPGIESEILN